MASFELKFKTDNAAFADGSGESEIARILRQLADKIEDGDRDDMQLSVYDMNGNLVGGCYFTLPRPDDE